MKDCFDTSTLVAALLQQHPHHAVAFPRLRAVHEGSIQGHLTTHGLAELSATLTALPLRPRLLPADVQRLIEKSVLKHLALIPLGPREYQHAMDLTVAKTWPAVPFTTPSTLPEHAPPVAICSIPST